MAETDFSHLQRVLSVNDKVCVSHNLVLNNKLQEIGLSFPAWPKLRIATCGWAYLPRHLPVTCRSAAGRAHHEYQRLLASCSFFPLHPAHFCLPRCKYRARAHNSYGLLTAKAQKCLPSPASAVAADVSLTSLSPSRSRSWRNLICETGRIQFNSDNQPSSDNQFSNNEDNESRRSHGNPHYSFALDCSDSGQGTPQPESNRGPQDTQPFPRTSLHDGQHRTTMNPVGEYQTEKFVELRLTHSPRRHG